MKKVDHFSMYKKKVKQAKNKYRKSYEEDKNIKREYGKSKYYNMFEDKKQKLKKYQKNYREAKKKL